MAQRVTGWDIAFFCMTVVGLAAGLFHIFDGRVMFGVIILAVMAVGVVVRLSMIAFPEERPAATQRVSNGPTSFDRFVSWVSSDGETDRSSWLRSGIIAGFLATMVMTGVLVAGYLTAGVLGQMNNGIGDWFYGLTHNSLTDNAFDIPIGAYSLNLLAGIVWAIIYAAVIEPRMSGPAWRRGALFSLLPWLLSLVVFFPIVGAGFLGLDLDAGPLPIIGNLILHLSYGITLGVAYAIPETSGVTRSADTEQAARWEDRGLALGLSAGLVVGVVIGGILSLIVDGSMIKGSEFLLAGAAGGVTFGAVVGPLIGLDYRERHIKPQQQAAHQTTR